MATLVTGGTGFIGSNIVKDLARRGHDVVCFDLAAPDALVRKYLAPWGERVTFIRGDILNRGDLERAARHHITRIVHAAVFTPSRTSNIETDRSRSIVDINLAGTADLLDMARALDTERFLYVSSEAVYGDGPGHREMVGEDAILYPRNLYAVAKYASELLTRRYGELHGFQTVSVRLSYPYGPMERVTGHRTRMSQIYRWTGNAVRGEPVQVEDRTVGHDYTYAADVASGISALLDAPSLSHDVYNLSAGRSITLGEVIEALREARPSLKVIDNTPGEPESLLPSPGTQIRDVTRIQEDLGFTPSFDIAAGIRDYLKWREDFSFRD